MTVPVVPDHEHPVLTLAEAAGLLRISMKSALRLAREGKIPGQLPRYTQAYRIARQPLVDWLNTPLTTREEAEHGLR